MWQRTRAIWYDKQEVEVYGMDNYASGLYGLKKRVYTIWTIMITERVCDSTAICMIKSMSCSLSTRKQKWNRLRNLNHDHQGHLFPACIPSAPVHLVHLPAHQYPALQTPQDVGLWWTTVHVGLWSSMCWVSAKCRWTGQTCRRNPVSYTPPQILMESIRSPDKVLIDSWWTPGKLLMDSW